MGPFASSNQHGRRKVRSLVGLVLVVALIEAVLRFGLGLGNPILIQPDAACSYILKPDQDVVRFFAHTRINHYGMRSDEVTPNHNPGTLRLLFLGDSVTYGTTRVDQNGLFTEILHRELPEIAHRPLEVLNASAGAWAPHNELSYIQSRGIFQSDFVLLVLNDGDLSQPRATMADVGDNLPQKRPLTAIGELFSRFVVPHVVRMVRRQDAGDSVAADAGEVTRDNLAVLDKFRELVNAQGATPVIVYIPFRKDIPQQSRASALALHAWSDEHSVAIIDLTSAELGNATKDISLDDGTHLNARGHLVVARAIEQAWTQVAAANSLGNYALKGASGKEDSH